jgi:hypothetical protein
MLHHSNFYGKRDAEIQAPAFDNWRLQGNALIEPGRIRYWIAVEKRVFYEQVTGVKGLFFAFSFLGFLLFVVALGFVALHRVSIRTLDELSWSKLGAGWGSRGESMLPFIGRPQKTKTRTQSSEYGVVATGKQDHL